MIYIYGAARKYKLLTISSTYYIPATFDCDLWNYIGAYYSHWELFLLIQHPRVTLLKKHDLTVKAAECHSGKALLLTSYIMVTKYIQIMYPPSSRGPMHCLTEAQSS